MGIDWSELKAMNAKQEAFFRIAWICSINADLPQRQGLAIADCLRRGRCHNECR